jgi:predicted dehydrogenase
MLDIAIVGLGGIGNNHARCYTANKYTRVVAVCDIIKEKADAAAERYNARAFYSVKEMLKSGIHIDACSVTTAGVENGGDHYKPTMELLEAGLPVLGEKPISNDVSKARKMVALAKKKRISYGVNLNHRFTPSAVRAKEWLEAGRLGELNIVNMTMWINNPNESSPWFHIRALHPHSLDVMRYFAGEVDKVQAFFKKGKGRKIWSNVQVNVQFKNGVIGHLTGSYDAGGSYGLETLELVGYQRGLREAELLSAFLARGRELRPFGWHGHFWRNLCLAHRRLGRRLAQEDAAEQGRCKGRRRAQGATRNRIYHQIVGDRPGC